MADKYSWIVFTHRSIGCAAALKNIKSSTLFKSEILKNKVHDEEFYETMFSFSARVL